MVEHNHNHHHHNEGHQEKKKKPAAPFQITQRDKVIIAVLICTPLIWTLLFIIIITILRAIGAHP